MNRSSGFTVRLLPLAAVLLAAACQGDRRDAAAGGDVEGGQPESGGTAVLVESADISQPSSLFFSTALAGNLTDDVLNMQLLHSGWEGGRLVHMTAEQSPMALARGYEFVGPDSAAVRFHMRSDVKWSDGQPLTARDVVFTYGLVKLPEVASPRQDYVEQLDSVVAQDDSTVTFHFKRRYPEMLGHASLSPVPQHVYRDVAPGQLSTHPTLTDPANGRLVVSGPFMIGQWQKGQQLVLVPNPHFLPRPNLERIVIRIIPEATTRLVELQTGNVDLVHSIAFDQIPRLQQQAPQVRFLSEKNRLYEFIAYNPKANEAFADPEVRRALGLAIDVPGILKALQMGEYAIQAGGPYPPIFTELYDPELMPPLPHDVEEAKRILEAKGWKDGDGDGIRERNGKPLRFTLTTNAGNQRRNDVTQIVQSQWKQIGVDARLQQLEFNTMMDDMVKQKYEAVLSGWQVSLLPDLTGLWAPESPLNITKYSNPEVSALMTRALAQPTEEAAVPYWKQAAARLVQDQPYTWLYYYDAVNGVNQRLRNVKVNTYGSYQNAWEWWIPRSRQGGVQTSQR